MFTIGQMFANGQIISNRFACRVFKEMDRYSTSSFSPFVTVNKVDRGYIS